MTLPYWTCTCGKRAYQDRATAKQAGKATGPGLVDASERGYIERLIAFIESGDHWKDGA